MTTDTEDAPAGLVIEKRSGTAGVVLVLAGYLDLSTAPTLADALRDALDEAPDVSLDVAGVTFLDSSGLREFVLGYQAAEAAGKGYRVVGAQRQVKQVLEIAGMLEYLTEGRDAG
jgi:anti-sigma B factor antagonist